MSTPPVPRSRRERPSKRALSREWIIETTIDIMSKEGLGKATMRRVAQALDTGPASLYVYIANASELHAAVLDELLGSLQVPSVGDWPIRLEVLLRDYRTLLSTYPGLARSAMVIRPSGPNSIRFIDQALGLLLQGGADSTRASWGVDLLILQVTASAAEHAAPAPNDIDIPEDGEAAWNALTTSIRAADPQVVPNVAAHADELLGGTPEQRWTWAVHSVIAAITGTTVPPPPPSAPSGQFTDKPTPTENQP